MLASETDFLHDGLQEIDQLIEENRHRQSTWWQRSQWEFWSGKRVIYIPIRLQTRNQTRSPGERTGSDRELGNKLGDGVLEIWRLERERDPEWMLEFDVSHNPTQCQIRFTPNR